MKLRLGTRGSALARAQSGLMAEELRRRGHEVELVEIRTTGDVLSAEQRPIEGKGIFTRELDEALRERRVDLAVHSLKDLPSELAADLVLAAVPPREDPRDAIVSRGGRPLILLPAGSRIGTGSPRRAGQIRALRPDVECLEARGNVDTRLRRLSEGRWDAIVLAAAGMRRLGRIAEATQLLAIDEMIPAPGQGALALVTHRDGPAREVAALDDPRARAAVEAERRLLALLEGGCRAPIAIHATVEGGRMTLRAAVFSPDGARMLRERGEDEAARGEALAARIGEALLARGAADVVAAAREIEARP